MNFSGIILGASAFIIIGLFHPIVIKAEYHLGKRCWWMFALVGLGFPRKPEKEIMFAQYASHSRIAQTLALKNI